LCGGRQKGHGGEKVEDWAKVRVDKEERGCRRSSSADNGREQSQHIVLVHESGKAADPATLELE
jgi:hypothetical protein